MEKLTHFFRAVDASELRSAFTARSTVRSSLTSPFFSAGAAGLLLDILSKEG